MNTKKEQPCQRDALMCLEERKQLEICLNTGVSIFGKVVFTQGIPFSQMNPTDFMNLFGVKKVCLINS